MAIEVEVVYADQLTQNIIRMDLPASSTVREAILQSGILSKHPELGSVDNLTVGIFGKLRSLDWNLTHGARVEIYKPLLIDPKDARKLRAKQQRKRALAAKMAKKNPV